MTRTTGTYERSTVAGESVEAFIPRPLPPTEPPLDLSGDLALLLARANESVRLLELAGDLVPSIEWFVYAFVRADLSSTIIGSSYDFVRVQAGWREWVRLPEARHTLRLGLFLGAAIGDVPFFYKFYASDLSDLIPSRVLELNLDRRAPPNLLDTSVREMRAQELAGRLDVEYAIWIYEGNDALRGLQLYGLVGVYALMDRADIWLAIPGYNGFARVPLDLTFDVGVRFDTVVGVFELGFSTLLGFISL